MTVFRSVTSTDNVSKNMATLSLRIHILDGDVTKTMQFDPSTSVYDVCVYIREKILEANRGDSKDYGLFLSDDDLKKGVWLEPSRSLDYYILRNGDLLEYRKKTRPLKVQMLDGSLKTMMIDDSQPVANLMVVICTKIGITNYDEYGLVRESNAEEESQPKNANFGTLTLRRKREPGDRDAKMDQLRKKLNTDDEVNWIDPSKTLREQGVEEYEPVLLRRKFFFSDGNVDSHDPVQLNLLYVQARDTIINGTHPVTEDLACQLAGIQTHIQFGNHNETKHKPPFLDLKEFLPQSYVKIKGIEKKIFAEHKKHYGLAEIDAKVLYTKTCRSLPTYGVTFFLVKEKMKSKNKLVPRLLGITKDSVLRLDEHTKEILKSWPLTTVKRWCASPNTFTLDFGDYSDQYYAVQTKDAEQISHVISGYIDIILKKKKSKDHFGIEGEEGSTMIEDSVIPSKASILQHEDNKVGRVNTESVAKPAIMRAGTEGAKPYSTGCVESTRSTTITGQINITHTPPVMLQQRQITNVTMTEPQRALLSRISVTRETIRTVEEELTTEAVLPDFGYDMDASTKWREITVDANKQNISSQIAAINAATAQIITLTSGEYDYNAVENAITSITEKLPDIGQNVKIMAALSPCGDKLVDAARKLCSAFTDLLNTVQPQSTADRQNLLSAASRVGKASQSMLSEIGTRKDEIKDVLLGIAKSVANTTAVLVIKAKTITTTVNEERQKEIIASATSCALATSQLVACTKVVSATMNNALCREQLVKAAKEVMFSVEELVTICRGSVPTEKQELLNDLTKAASEVSSTLNQLLIQVETRSFTCVKTFHVDDYTEKQNESLKNFTKNTTNMKLLHYESEDSVTEKSFSSFDNGRTSAASVYSRGRPSDHEQFTVAVRKVCDAVCGLTEAAARSPVNHIEITHQSGEKQEAAIVDEELFAQASLSIREACAILTNQTSNQEQVLIAARTIAKYTSSLCNACRIASAKTSDPIVKRQFVQYAKDVANATSNLVKEIKALDVDYNIQNRQLCAASTRFLLAAIDSLIAFADNSGSFNRPIRTNGTYTNVERLNGNV